MTQQELAERAKISVEAISTLECGARTRPYPETVALLARALGFSPEREDRRRGVPDQDDYTIDKRFRRIYRLTTCKSVARD